MEERPIVIANEFGEVYVRKVYTRNGERLEIYTPKLGYRVHLDALDLESLTWQPPEVFSHFLRTPFGPEAMRVRPLSELFQTNSEE